ncbi:MAG: hypothetical protein GY710_11315 [Desulfobacteraceae bacterium]|nr:hypothetical protein [Desulfobacteraceae bacterium]
MKTDSRYHFILGKNEALLLGAMGKENIGKQFIDVLNTHHKKIINQ